MNIKTGIIISLCLHLIFLGASLTSENNPPPILKQQNTISIQLKQAENNIKSITNTKIDNNIQKIEPQRKAEKISKPQSKMAVRNAVGEPNKVESLSTNENQPIASTEAINKASSTIAIEIGRLEEQPLDIQFYIQAIEQKIAQQGKLYYPSGAEGRNVKITFSIEKDGGVGIARIQRTSGSEDIDTKTINLLNAIAPFSKPSIINKEQIIITRVFNFK